jgi:type I restriction enzyme R subunit
MNEAETRRELIDPKLKQCGWGVVDNSKVLCERNVNAYQITDGCIQTGGGRAKPLIADYILVYKGVKLAIIEAKNDKLQVSEGVTQAKLYAQKLNLETTYATNGKEIYQVCLKTGEEKLVNDFLSPQALWDKTYSQQNQWREKFSAVAFEDKSGTWQPRFYQEIAIRNVLEAIAQNQKRILLTLATGTGKTAIAFQIAWKLFQTRWNLSRDGKRQPRILFLADRNILADQAFNAFSAFDEDAMIRITPKEIKKTRKVPTNGSIFFTIFQSLMANDNTAENIENAENDIQNPINFDTATAYYNQYPKDYFDFIIIDECHRGGANDEGSWRGILEHFSPAVQLGLTATPKRKDNADTYKYFGEPVYSYSLKEGINDGFLTPFKVKRIKTTLDDYIYTNDDTVIEGDIEEGKLYKEKDFNKNIEIKEREKKRIKIFMNDANSNDKTIIFCATQEHAALVRDLVNQYKKYKDINYCVRVTADDGEIGNQFLKAFQDNEKTIPTILTTSQKLSTGVDARNIRNIVLMRPVNQIIEFKQIIGRGTRLFEGKEFFTIYDFVDAYQRFSDPEWDGEPVKEECIDKLIEPNNALEIEEQKADFETEPKPKKIKIKLKNGKELEIQYMVSTSFWNADGNPISVQDFLNNLFGELPNLFKDEAELCKQWSNPDTRKILLEKLDEAGFGKDKLITLQKLINAENSDLFDVLKYVFNSDIKPISRKDRVAMAKSTIFLALDNNQQEFIEFVLKQYIKIGVGELDEEKLPALLFNKYHSIEDATNILGETTKIRALFTEFQQYLYEQMVA